MWGGRSAAAAGRAMSSMTSDDSAVWPLVEIISACFPGILIKVAGVAGALISWCCGRSVMGVLDCGIGGGRINDSNDGSGETESSLLTGAEEATFGSRCFGRAPSIDNGSLFPTLKEACLRRVIAFVAGDDRALRAAVALEAGFSFRRGLFDVPACSEQRSTGEEVAFV